MKKCSGLNQERNLHHIKHCLQDKTALNKYVAGFWCERQQEMHFSLEEALLWIMDSYFAGSNSMNLTAPIHCSASIAETVMQCYISPNLMKKQTHPNLSWTEGEEICSKHSFLHELAQQKQPDQPNYKLLQVYFWERLLFAKQINSSVGVFWKPDPCEQLQLLFSSLFFSPFAWTSTQKLSNSPSILSLQKKCSHER